MAELHYAWCDVCGEPATAIHHAYEAGQYLLDANTRICVTPIWVEPCMHDRAYIGLVTTVGSPPGPIPAISIAGMEEWWIKRSMTASGS